MSQELGLLSSKKEENRTEAVSQLELGNQTVDRDDVHRGPITVWIPEVYLAPISTLVCKPCAYCTHFTNEAELLSRVYPLPLGIDVNKLTIHGSEVLPCAVPIGRFSSHVI